MFTGSIDSAARGKCTVAVVSVVAVVAVVATVDLHL